MSNFLKQNLIFIRKLKKSDLKKLVKFRNKKIIWKLTGGDGFSKKVTINDEIAWFKKVNKKKDRLNLAICLEEKYIGNIYFTDIKNSSAQFHIFIGENSLSKRRLPTNQPRAHSIGASKTAGCVGHRQIQGQGIASHSQHDLNVK